MAFWLALQFLTIIPVPALADVGPKRAGASLAYFPVVGLIIGLVIFGLGLGLSYILPAMVVSALVVLFLVVITGGHHLDGLADTCDGLVSGRTPEERLALMGRGGIGAFGAAGVGLLLLLKFAALFSAGSWDVLVLVPVLGRWVVVGVVLSFPYARVSGMGTPYKQGARWRHFIVATLVALMVSVVMYRWTGTIIMLVVWGVAYSVATLLMSKLKGLTGDSYGAIIEVSELAVLVVVNALQKLTDWLD